MRNYIKRGEQITHLVSTHKTEDDKYETIVVPAYYKKFLGKQFIEVDWNMVEDKLIFSKSWMQSLAHWWMIVRWSRK
jgi:hypothetical protein